jgi:two-component system sensor histidine kinase VanS
LKNRYGKLKRTILLRSLLWTVLAVGVGYGILTFLVDGIFQDSFASLVVRFFVMLGAEYWRAEMYYREIFVYNKSFFVMGGIGFSEKQVATNRPQPQSAHRLLTVVCACFG